MMGDYATTEPGLTEFLVGELGPARRHLQRILDGVMPPSPAVIREIQKSVERCVKSINQRCNQNNQNNRAPEENSDQRKKCIADLTHKFLMWPLPDTVCSDLCVTRREYQFPRSGTNLLSAEEAEKMIEYLLGESG